jgi:hypothetical protein
MEKQPWFDGILERSGLPPLCVVITCIQTSLKVRNSKQKLYTRHTLTSHQHIVMMLVVWVRYTFMTAEIINEIDASTPEKPDKDIHRKVDEYCTNLVAMVEEFKLESTMKDDASETLRYLVADHVMTIYSFIIGIRRLLRKPGSQNQVDSVAVAAARKVVQFTIDFAIDSAPAKEAQSLCIQ